LWRWLGVDCNAAELLRSGHRRQSQFGQFLPVASVSNLENALKRSASGGWSAAHRVIAGATSKESSPTAGVA
jgi:hypothetical protein